MNSIRYLSRNFLCKKIIRYSEIRTLVRNITDDNILNSGKPDMEMPNLTLPEYLTTLQTKFEKYVMIECAETKRKYTFGEVRDKSTKLSKSIANVLKMNPGDVVAIVLKNIPEYPIVTNGIMKANLVATPVSPAFTSDEIARQIVNSGAKAVITDVDSISEVTKALMLAKKNIITIVIKTKNHQSIPENCINFHEFIEAKNDSNEIVPCDPGCTAFLPYSSGTTGLPKGVMLTHRNLVSNLVQNRSFELEYHNVAEGDNQEILPTILPFYHSFGHLIMTGVNSVGGKLITLPNFSQDLYISVLKNNPSTHLYVVPPIVLMLTYNDDIKTEYLKNVRVIGSGGAPLAASDEKQLLQKMNRDFYLIQGYGLTETSPTATALYPSIMQNIDSYRGSIGWPVKNTLIKIVNPDDSNYTPLLANTTGELLIKGPQVMAGYHNLPEETEKVITKDGWLRSGDLGHYNNEGFLFITDRLKELIKVNGNQVPPAELEGVIRAFSGVTDAAVIGIPHATAGEVPRAYVVVEKDFNAEKLNNFVNERVAKYKQLKGGIAVVKEIPKNAAGKILRRELRETFLKEGK